MRTWTFMLLLSGCSSVPAHLRVGEHWFQGTVLVEKDGELLLRRGYGFAPETPFWIASISKQFTAAAILRLEEQGKLSTSDPISAFIEDVSEEKRAITIHQLLTHTAGLSKRYAADGIADRDRAIGALLAAPLQSTPGSAFAYTNDAYNLLAAIVELAAKEPFETYLQREVFDAAHLKQTGFWRGERHTSVAGIRGSHAAENMPANWGFRGATGMYSTIDDLLRWYHALPSVLSQASLQKLWSPHVPLSDGGHAAYGWFLTPTDRGSTSLWTRGTEDMGHNAILMAFPEEKLVIVAASNAGDRDGIAASRKLVEELAKAVRASPRN